MQSNQPHIPWKWIAVSVTIILLYTVISYTTLRHNSIVLLSLYSSLFALYVWIIVTCKEDETNTWFVSAVVFRAILLFAIPNLSDDFYRFIWDGRLLQAGIHPFAEVPSFYLQSGNEVSALTPQLFEKINSKQYFTIYPPVAQFVFWFSVILSPDSVFASMFIMKLFVLVSEIGTLVIMQKLLLHFSLPTKNILLYALNPLIILELTGNLHFEAFMIFFLLLSFYLLLKHQLFLSSVIFALAVNVKLIPLIFLPALLPFIGWKKSIQFYLVTAATTVVVFIPLLNLSIVSGFTESIGYYFKKFEFNASIYYLVREWGFWKYGYNIVQTIGWKLGLISGLLIVIYSCRRFFTFKSVSNIQQLIEDWLIILFIYLLLSTTAHPWYCAPLVAFCVFTKYRFPIVWSLLIFLTYVGYTYSSYTENLWIVAIEYCIVLGFLFVEIWKGKLLLHSSS